MAHPLNYRNQDIVLLRLSTLDKEKLLSELFVKASLDNIPAMAREPNLHIKALKFIHIGESLPA